MTCKRCGGNVAHPQAPEFRLQVVAHPYNPEWPLEYHDAGIFCSGGCLADYLKNSDPTP